MTKIFISYRRDDSADIAGRIFDRLIAKFGRDPRSGKPVRVECDTLGSAALLGVSALI